MYIVNQKSPTEAIRVPGVFDSESWLFCFHVNCQK